MADDVERAPSVFAFIAEGPLFRQITQKGIESSRCASEKRYGVRQVVFHDVPYFVEADSCEALIVSILRGMRQRTTWPAARQKSCQGREIGKLKRENREEEIPTVHPARAAGWGGDAQPARMGTGPHPSEKEYSSRRHSAISMGYRTLGLSHDPSLRSG